MASNSNRSYSIKFKSEGLQALIKDLKSAGATFDEVLLRSQKSVDKSLRDRSQQVVAEAQSNARRTSAAIGASSPKVVAFRNENSVAPRLVVYNSPFKQNPAARPPDPLAKLQARDRALVEVWRNEYRNFFTEFKAELKDGLKGALQKEENLAGRIISAPFNLVGQAIKFPFEATLLGAFSGFGEKLTGGFSTGFVSKLEKGVGLSLTETGQDLGDIVGKALYRTYEAAIKAVQNSILEEGNPGIHLEEFVEDMQQAFLGAGIQASALPIRAHKRIQMNKKALPETMRQAGELLMNNEEMSFEEIKSIDKSESITLLVGGVNMDPEARNTEYVGKLLQPLLKSSHVVPVKNFWSNSTLGEEFRGVASAFIKKLLDFDLSKNTLKDFLKNQGFDKSLTPAERKEFEVGDSAKLVDKMLDFFESKDIPVGKAFESAFKGYNPDDVLIAAKAMYYRQLFPNKPINLVGTSFGGFNAAGAQEILQRLGYKDIKAAGITTPFTGLEFTGDTDNFFASIGTADPLYKMSLGSTLQSLLPPDFLQVIQGAGQKHLLAAYLANPDFKAGFQGFFQNRFRLPKNVGLSELAYLSKRAEGDESGSTDQKILRTLFKSLGEPTSEGFSFDVESLKGLTQDIKKKANRIKNTDIKQEAEIFLRFLNTLIEELTLIQQLGKRYKPVKSLRLAVSSFPQLQPLLENYQDTGVSEKVLFSLGNSNKNNKKLVDFKAEIKSETPNIERTFKTLFGQEVEGYSYFDPTNFQQRAEKHLGGLIGYMQGSMLEGASPKQKAKASKYISFLKRLQQAILERGEKGTLPVQLAQEATELLGLDLSDIQKFIEKGGTEALKQRLNPDETIASALKQPRKPRKATDRGDLKVYLKRLNRMLAAKKLSELDPESTDYLGSGFTAHVFADSNTAYKLSKVDNNSISRSIFKSSGGLISSLGSELGGKEEIAVMKKLGGKKAPLLRSYGRGFIAMERLKGENLSDLFRVVNEQERHQLIREAGELLRYLHSQGVTHNDLATGNILRTETGELKAIDFQKAKRIRSKKDKQADIETTLTRFRDFVSGHLKLDSAETIEELLMSGYHNTQQRSGTSPRNTPPLPPPTPATLAPFKKSLLPEPPKETAARYTNYLQQLKAATTEELGGSAADLPQTLKAIKQQLREYRKAIADGQLKIAKNLGENLLEIISAVKEVAASSGDVSPQTLGTLSRYQNEILRGDKGKGRAQIGLTQLAESNPNFQALLRQFQNAGSNVAKGLASGVKQNLGSVQKVGEELGEAAIKGAEGELEIKSPSRRFVRIGKFIVDGLRQGIRGIKDVFTNDVAEEISAGADESLKAAQLAKSEQLDRFIISKSGSPEKGAANLKFVEEEARRLSLDLEATKSAYAKLLASTQGTTLEGQGERINKTFSAIASTDANKTSIDADPPEKAKVRRNILELFKWTKREARKSGTEANREFFDYLFKSSYANHTIDNALGQTFVNLRNFFKDIEEKFPIVTRLKSVVASIGTSMLAMFGVFTSGDAIVRLGLQALETARKFEQLDRVILSASGSAEKGAANLRFIASEARRLSLDLEVAKASYGKLLASAQGTALEGEATNQIFSAIGEAALNKGLNREGQERVFLAIQQIISKGKVSAEELRQQLGEALPGTLQTASRALGVTTQQIDRMLQSGELVATDFLPKFAAQLSAENAGGVAGAANSAQASLTRFNNATTEFQRSLGEGLKPAEKLGLNTLSTILEFLRDKTDESIKSLLALVLVLAWQLIAKLIASKAAAEGLALGFATIKNAILSALPAIAAFLSKLILMNAAIETWLNVYKLTQDSFKDIADYANASAKGLDNLARAYSEAGKAAKQMPAPPKPTEELNSKEGPEFLGMRWNFDTVFRNPTNPIIKALTFSPLRSLALAPFGGGKTTQGEREYNDFIVNASDLMVGANRNIGESLNAKEIIAQVQELDRQLETVRSRRFDLLPGDRTGLAQSIEQEQSLLKEREKLLKITSTISTNFARDSENIKKTLETIERLPEGANTEAIRAQLESTLSALSQSQSAFDELISSVGRSISESDRRLRTLTEGMSEFNDSLQINATLARARVIREGVNRGLTRPQIDRYTQHVSVRENQLQLSQLQKAIAQIRQDLQNPIHAQSLENLGIDPENAGSAQLERMLGEGRSAQEQSTLKTVQKLKQLKQEAANAEYQMAQAQQALIDAQNNYFLQLFNFWLQLKRQFEDLAIQTSDTLEEIRRQFVSTVQSIKQTQNQTAFTSLKAILTQPLVTQAERLINATNDAFEQYLNSLTQEIEQAFSRAALDLNLEQQFEQINNAITDANRQQRDRVRNSTRQGEDTIRQWWDIRRQSPFAPGKGGSTTMPGSAVQQQQGSANGSSGAGSSSNPTSPETSSSPLGIIYGISGEAALNPYIPEDTIRGSEQNISLDVGLLPASIQQANDATQQATQQQIEALEGQRTAVEQLTDAQRALGEMEARLSAQQRRNNLIRYLQDTGYAAETLSNQVADLEDKYSESTPLRQHSAALRSIEQEYLSLGRQTRNQLNTLIQQRDRFQELSTILKEQGVPGLQAYQQQLLQGGNIKGAESIQKIIDSVGADAGFLEKQLPRIQGLINSYQQELNSLGDVYQTAKDRQELLNIFNERSFEFEKTKTINQLDNQLREAQAGLLGNTYGRKTEAAQLEKTKALTEASDRYEQQRLDLSKDIALNPTKYTKEQIQRIEAALERWFDATLETIDRQYQVRIDFDQREYNLQRSRGINEIGNQLLGSQSQFLQNRGDEFSANDLLQKQAEIQEGDRYQQQLFELEKDAAINPTKYTPEELAQLKADLLEINSFNLKNIDKQFKDLGETIASVSEGALEEFFSSFFTNTKSMGEAFRDAALSIVRSLATIAAKQTVLSILGRGGGAFAQLFGMAAPAPLPAFASGGSVQGAGTGTSDSILARLSNGEFVMRAAAVRHWGEDFLADLNSMRSPQLALATSERRSGNTGRTPTPTVILNVTTPDANSFRRSEAQIGREAGELYRRSLTRQT